MQTSDKGRAYIRSHENDVLKAYLCPAGKWTIGVGLTKASGVVDPKPGMTITKADSERLFSTALRQGDRFARVSRVYDQQSWDGVTWYDGLDPSNGAATATYDTTNYPIEVNNRGAITERWALRFRSGGQVFDMIGQHLGQIATGSVNEDFSPMNLAAGAPYMTIRAGGWGSGWAAGNVLFTDTIGAEAPIDCVRCVQPGSPAGIDDRAWIVQRGDVGRDPESDF